MKGDNHDNSTEEVHHTKQPIQAKALKNITQTEKDIEVPTSTSSEIEEPHMVGLPEARGDIVFENVGLKAGDNWLLHNINLRYQSSGPIQNNGLCATSQRCPSGSLK